MRTRWVVGWVVLFVVLNAAMVWYLRDRMSHPPAVTSGAPTRAPAPSSSAEAEVSGEVFLAGAPSGEVLRLTHGDCNKEGADPVAGWIAPPGGPPAGIGLPAVSEALGIGRAGGAWWFVGADEGCDISAWKSRSLAGGPWSETAIPADAWYLDPEDATQVYSPRGALSLPGSCSATWVQAVATQVYLVCQDGRAQVADAGIRSFAPLPLDATVVALAADPDGRIAQLSSSLNCRALIRVVDRQRPTSQHCFEQGKAPLGVAWVGGDLVVQVGYSLMTNAGGTWVERS